jgi:hypothetical protein
MTLSARDQETIREVFSYKPANDYQIGQMNRVREKAREFAVLLLETCPRCPDRSVALRRVREAMMTANAAIVLDGRSLPS